MLAAGLFTVSARADEWSKRTILTVNEPIMIKDKVLEPGTYVLRLILNGTAGVDRHVVQIFDGDEHHIIGTVITQPTIRERTTADTVFTYWETPAGSTKALRDWYYPGENVGDEFPNPGPRQVTFVPPPAVIVASSEATTTTTPAEQPVVMDDTTQATPPPAVDQTPAPAPAPADNSADRSAPTELPKTGSPYPLIGLCGFGLAGLAGALALKRPA
jgi:LPXTG-motif cell wall-anchored protein